MLPVKVYVSLWSCLTVVEKFDCTVLFLLALNFLSLCPCSCHMTKMHLPSMPHSLEASKNSSESINNLAMPSLCHDMCIVVPYIRSSTTHYPGLVELHTQGEATQEVLSGLLGQIFDPFTVDTEWKPWKRSEDTGAWRRADEQSLRQARLACSGQRGKEGGLLLPLMLDYLKELVGG